MELEAVLEGEEATSAASLDQPTARTRPHSSLDFAFFTRIDLVHGGKGWKECSLAYETSNKAVGVNWWLPTSVASSGCSGFPGTQARLPVKSASAVWSEGLGAV